jgi:hypothetical protein
MRSESNITLIELSKAVAIGSVLYSLSPKATSEGSGGLEIEAFLGRRRSVWFAIPDDVGSGTRLHVSTKLLVIAWVGTDPCGDIYGTLLPSVRA